MNNARRPYYLASVLLLVGVLVYADYFQGLENRWLFGPPLVRYYTLYAFPFWSAFGLYYLFSPGTNFHRSIKWWVALLGAPALFALRSSFHFPGSWAPAAEGYRAFVVRSTSYLIRASCLILPVFLFWLLFDRRREPVYGLTKPVPWYRLKYLFLLTIPLLFFAATQSSFLASYPKARCLYPIPGHSFFNLWYYAVFEGSYGLDLFSMEFFFRGLLVIGMFRICKVHSIVPAAVFYCVVHFGRPLGECVSSFFGGVLLGMLALRTRSIYPGVLLHLLLAWGMEALTAVNLPSLLR